MAAGPNWSAAAVAQSEAAAAEAARKPAEQPASIDPERHQQEPRRLPSSKKRSVGSVDQFMRAPTVQGAALAAARRKSECNRMLSMAEPTGDRELGVPEPEATRSASACCSFPSLDGSNRREAAQSGNQREQQVAAASGSLASGGHSSSLRSPSSQSNKQQQQHPQHPQPPMLRKSSLNMVRSAGNATDHRAATNHHHLHQHSTLKGTHSVCSDGASLSELAALGERQNIGDLERELEALKVRLDRRIGGVKMSKVTQSYLSYFKQWCEYDPFIAQPIPSNPWISDSTELWDSERQTKDVHCRRVRRWAFSLKELLNDPAGREQFHRFLEKEFSAENLK